MSSQRCRSCSSALIWGLSAAGKPSPIDSRPHDEGNVLLVRHGGLDGVLAITLSGELLDRARARGVPLRMSHFATCEHAAQHRQIKEIA